MLRFEYFEYCILYWSKVYGKGEGEGVGGGSVCVNGGGVFTCVMRSMGEKAVRVCVAATRNINRN